MQKYPVVMGLCPGSGPNLVRSTARAILVNRSTGGALELKIRFETGPSWHGAIDSEE